MIQPLFARVLIQREQITSTTVLIPDSVNDREAPNKGGVLAVGPNVDATIDVGDVVIFGKFAGTYIDEKASATDDGAYYIVQDEDILAVIREE